MEFGDCSLWHHLIFCDELASDADNNDVCEFSWLCEKPVFGCPAYKCLECNFLIHASCADMYVGSHERHHLIYVEVGENESVCVGCGEPASGPTYKCAYYPDCPFLLHKSCTHLSHVTRHHHAEQPDHISTLQFRYRERCEVCGDRQRYSLFYGCRICDITIHERCVFRLQVSPLLRQIPFTCQAGGGNEREGGAHVCAGCGVLTHRECAKFPHTITVYTHGHSLTRTYFILQVKNPDPIFCNICYKTVNTEGGAYYCRQCDYIVHMKCAIDSEYERMDESERINFNEYKAHMIHLVEGLNGREGEGETTSPSKINHFSHQQHELILSYEEPLDETRCEACALLIIFAPFYSCQHCSFFLHCKCAKLPPTITRGPFHEHPFTVVTTAPSTELFWCDFCHHTRHGLAYVCNAGCSGPKMDVQCLFIPEKLNHESHTHPFFLVVETYYEWCNGCGEDEVTFRCTDCQFNLCWKCIILPLVTRHPCLTYGHEDDLEVYYCFNL